MDEAAIREGSFVIGGTAAVTTTSRTRSTTTMRFLSFRNPASGSSASRTS